MPSSRQPPFRRSPPSVLPEVEPIIPVERPTAWNDPDWLFEPKHDGFRGLVYITPDGCTIRSKRGHRFKRFGALAGPLCEVIAARSAILDGEVLAVDTDGRPEFMGLLRGTGRLVYAGFDLLWVNGRDLRGLPLTRRKRHLEHVLPYEHPQVFRTMVVEEHGLPLSRR
jgi:bifunctional non-homologous end joining protein LigD